MNVSTTIEGGTLNTLHGGMMQTTAAGAKLDGSTQGAITLSDGSTYTSTAGETKILGTLTLGTATGSTLTLGGALELVGDTTLAGNGVVAMTGVPTSPGPVSGAQIGTDGNVRTLTIDSGVTVQGSGSVGVNATVSPNLNLDNAGTINGNSTTNALQIGGSGSVTNTGTFKASAGGTLDLVTSNPINNATGNITADNGVVNVSTTIEGGTLNTLNGGVMQTTAAGAKLDGITQGAITLSDGSTYTSTVINDGTIKANTSGQELLMMGTGPVTNNGTLQVDPGSTLVVTSQLTNFSGNTLTGGTYIVNGAAGSTGTMQLSSIGNNAAGEIVNNAANIVLNGPNANTLLIDAGGHNALAPLAANGTASSSLTIEGGYSFTAPGAFTNAGTVKLNTGGSFGSGGAFTNDNLVFGNGTVTVPISNTGTVEANGGTLAINGPITGTTGTIKSDAAATLDLSGAGGNSTAGELVNNGNLNIGSHNVTVTSDYTNASFGSGNNFNNHNAVSGTGKILAASATMDLSGLDLSGNTLDVGKVRTNGSTGSSSTTLTITNNGSSTDLIGAVQNTGRRASFSTAAPTARTGRRPTAAERRPSRSPLPACRRACSAGRWMWSTISTTSPARRSTSPAPSTRSPRRGPSRRT